MMSPTKRSISTAILVAAFLAVFGLTYFNPGHQFELALQMVLVTAVIVIAVNGIFRRDPPILLVAIGAGIDVYGTFTYQRIFFYVGTVIFVGATLLAARKYKTTPTPDSPMNTDRLS
jgi:hypothetical protein